MQAVDYNGQFVAVLDEDRKIPKAHLNTVCKLHCGKQTCRYIALGVKGFICLKRTKAKPVFDNLVNEGKMVAQGDNCEGLGSYDGLEQQSPPSAS